MDQLDHLRYIRELRPHEAETTVDWIKQGLNPVTISQMQYLLVSNGFTIKFWQEKSALHSHLQDLTNEIIQDSFLQYPSLSLSDLLAENIFLVAKKENFSSND